MRIKRSTKILAREILIFLTCIVLIGISFGVLFLINRGLGNDYQEISGKLYKTKLEFEDHPMTLMEEQMIGYVWERNYREFNSWKELNAEFPDLDHIEPKVLQEYDQEYNATYWAAVEENSAMNWDEMSRKFPEIFPEVELNELASIREEIEDLEIK